MKKLKSIITIALLVGVFTSCVKIGPWDGPNPGNQIEEIFNVNDFDGVDLGSAFNVLIVPGSEFKVTANGDERDVEDLNIRVINRTLKVNYLNRRFLSNFSRRRMDLFIETPELESADISGAATVDIEDFSYLNEFQVDLSGASKLNFDVETGTLTADISGASNLTATKEIPTIYGDISGASKLNAYEANSNEAYLELSGASRANVSVAEYLSVNASGASTVNYKGSPRIDQDLSGASKVTKY